MDALSDVLRAVRLTGAIFFDVHASQPWVAETPQGRSIVAAMFPGSEHLISYHVLASKQGLRRAPDMSLYRRPEEGQLPTRIAMGGDGGEPARFVCGFLGCDARPYNPLLAALPRVIRVSDEGSGALTALHRDPARPWTLESLARDAGLSRSAFAERFTEHVGQPPMHYLASWRMQLAANFLTTGSDSVAVVAGRVGYESEAAFSRAFKKAVGAPPSEWRRRREAEG